MLLKMRQEKRCPRATFTFPKVMQEQFLEFFLHHLIFSPTGVILIVGVVTRGKNNIGNKKQLIPLEVASL